MSPFRDLFCARFLCPADEYEDRAFGELLYGHAKVIAPSLHKLMPALFGCDFRFIRELGEAVDLREANISAAGFQDANWASHNFFRTRLRIRVSGRKASELARELFSEGQLSRR